MTKQMLKKRKLVDFKVGDLVHVSVPKIDQFGTDRPALPCKIIEKVREQYCLECKFGILNICYSSSELEALGTTIYPELNKIPSDKLSIREAARLQSVGSVSSVTCNCKGPCNNNKYKYKNMVENVQVDVTVSIHV